MKIAWEAVFATEKAQFEAMTERERFIYFLLLQYGSPYRWGEENPAGTDCSGSICLALYAATGVLIRLTADGLLKTIFSKQSPGRDGIEAAFFITDREKASDQETIPAGRAVHVAGILDEGIILNAQEPKARVRRLADIGAYFKKEGCSLLVRSLDKTALLAAGASAMNRQDVDAALGRYFLDDRRCA